MRAADLRRDVAQLAGLARNSAYTWVSMYAPATVDDLDDLWMIVGTYAETAAVLASGWYLEQEGSSTFSATMDADLPDEKMATVGSWMLAGPQTASNRAWSAADRVVFDAARRTVLVNAGAEGVPVVREEEGGCCNKCIARATTWPVDRAGESHTEDQFFHPGCQGLYVPVRTGTWEPPEHTSEWGEKRRLAILAGNTDAAGIAKWLDAH